MGIYYKPGFHFDACFCQDIAASSEKGHLSCNLYQNCQGDGRDVTLCLTHPEQTGLESNTMALMKTLAFQVVPDMISAFCPKLKVA